MEWSASSATEAYFDTLKLCLNNNRQRKRLEPESNEFISALAAGMNAKRILEVTFNVSLSTIALATAAKQTGGRFTCILTERTSNEYRIIIEESGLTDNVEFVVGNPFHLMPLYKNTDFALIDCRIEGYPRLLKSLEVNPKRAVIIANNLVPGKNGLAGHVRGVKDKVVVRSVKNLIGEGMEITLIGYKDELLVKRGWFKGGDVDCPSARVERKASLSKRSVRSKWVTKIDEESGEEHIYRVPRLS